MPATPFAAADTGVGTERVVSWLRLPAIALFAVAEVIDAPNVNHTAFTISLTSFSAWAVGMLAWSWLRPVGDRLALAATLVDVAAISALAVASGGGFSHSRLGYFLIPVLAAFRLRTWLTATTATLTTTAYVVESFAHSSSSRPGATRYIWVQAGFVAWIGLACVLLSFVLAGKAREVRRLADERTKLLADALEAEGRERQALAEALHDEALQNLLAVRHSLDEAAADGVAAGAAIARADRAVEATIAQLRNAVFELHPYVLEQAGLEAALRSIAHDTAERANLQVQLELDYGGRHANDAILFSAARELLANVRQHAHATRVFVSLRQANGEVRLVVKDDGGGFSAERRAEGLAEGHIGLASQQVRIEAAGGRFEIDSSPVGGTRVTLTLPAGSPRPD